MINISTILMHYKREDIQREMIEHAKDKEVVARFEDKFSNRPDVLKYPRDILELAKQGSTSFHASEELWENPLRLSTDMKKRDLENLRIGWDLIIDIDCPYWKYSKLITHLIIKALKKHGVSSISCKFSGNKGFHIGVPFEAFPKKDYFGEEIKLRFPDGVRIIAFYLTDYIEKEVSIAIQKESKNELAEKLGKKYEDMVKVICKKCGTEKIEEKKETEMLCHYCGEKHKIDDKTRFFQCRKCKKIVKLEEKEKQCRKCKSKKFVETFDMKYILNIDAILISSRHLYRMPYSLHEKTGLCSIPIDPDKVMEFEKEMAKPEKVKINFKFLDKKNTEKENAKRLFDDAFYWHYENVKSDDKIKEDIKENKARYEIKSALNEVFFPPCIKNILKGMSDGKKRSVFILINFLTSVGWEHEKIENFLREWNKKNSEELREVYYLGQLRYHKQQNKKILPPNCENRMYYKDMGKCSPDNLCSKIKNPVSYGIRKVMHREK